MKTMLICSCDIIAAMRRDFVSDISTSQGSMDEAMALPEFKQVPEKDWQFYSTPGQAPEDSNSGQNSTWQPPSQAPEDSTSRPNFTFSYDQTQGWPPQLPARDPDASASASRPSSGNMPLAPTRRNRHEDRNHRHWSQEVTFFLRTTHRYQWIDVQLPLTTYGLSRQQLQNITQDNVRMSVRVTPDEVE